MNDMQKAKVREMLEGMPVGRTFFASDLAVRFNRRGPTPSQVGHFLRHTGMAEEAKLMIQGILWRRV